MNIQFFAEGSGDGGDGNGNGNNGQSNTGNGNSNQNTGNSNQGATYTQEQLDGIVNSRTARAEQSALRSFFQQQGMSENEVTQAINSYKAQRAKNTPDVAGMQTELAQTKSQNQQLVVQNSATIQAVELGIDAKSIPYVIKMADFKEVMNTDGTVDAEKVKAAINKVLEDVPALKPADSGANNNQGFTQIGAPIRLVSMLWVYHQKRYKRGLYQEFFMFSFILLLL